MVCLGDGRLSTLTSRIDLQKADARRVGQTARPADARQVEAMNRRVRFTVGLGVAAFRLPEEFVAERVARLFPLG